MCKSLLVLAAHPDDEVLGCGGAIAKYVSDGYEVNVAFIADGVFSRQDTTLVLERELQRRREAARSALKLLGVSSIYFGDFPDNRLDSLPTLEIVKLIESLVDKYQPEIVLTHHFGDVNVDHKMVHEATVVACRPQPNHSVKTLLSYEVPSSTEWQLGGKGLDFVPNYFVDITDYLDSKLKSLSMYESEMRSSPHPRSIDGVRHLCKWRGATIGVQAAEAFMVGRLIR